MFRTAGYLDGERAGMKKKRDISFTLGTRFLGPRSCALKAPSIVCVLPVGQL